jgi:hypothetical protein
MDDDDDLVSNAPSGTSNVPLGDFESVANGLASTTTNNADALMPEEEEDEDGGGGMGSSSDDDDDDEGNFGPEDDDDDDDNDNDNDDDEEDGGMMPPSKRARRLSDDDEESGSSLGGGGDDEEEIPTGGFGAGMGTGGGSVKRHTDMSPEEIQQMKLDVLFKMGVLHGAGYKSPREYSVDDSLQSLQIELQRLQTAEDMAYGLEMCRWGVVNGVSVLESINEGLRLTPLKLKGWSATVHRRQHTLDPILLELYQTYFYKVHLGPFTKLSMALGLAAVNTHMANTVRANIDSGESASASGGGGGGGMPGFANVIGSMMSNFRPPMRRGDRGGGGGGVGATATGADQGSMSGPN